MNRATADNQSAQAEEEGLEPTKEWVKDLIDEIIAEEFSSPDLELVWLDEDEGDPETVLADRLKLGALTLNELRAHLGLDPYATAAADRPMVFTATGYVPIEANAGGEETGAGEKVQTAVTVLKASPDDPQHPGWPAGAPDGKGGQFRPKDNSGSAAGAQYAGGPNYPPPPLGYDPKTWKQGQWPNGRYWLEDPEGNKYTAHPEDYGHWRHWDKRDTDGNGQGRLPANSKKLQPNQTSPNADQSLTDPSGDAPPWTPSPFVPIVPIDPVPLPSFPIFPPAFVPG